MSSLVLFYILISVYLSFCKVVAKMFLLAINTESDLSAVKTHIPMKIPERKYLLPCRRTEG